MTMAALAVTRQRRWPVIVAFSVIVAIYIVGLVLVLRSREPLWPGFVNLAFFAFPVVGLLIALRRPGNRVAWLCLGIGLIWGTNAATNAAVGYEVVNPGFLGRPDLWLAFTPQLWVPGMLLMGSFLLLIFPDGHLPSPRWKPLAWQSGGLIVALYVFYIFDPVAYGDDRFPGLENPLGVEFLASTPAIEAVLVGLLPVCVLGSAAALLIRFRRATGIERLQLKWLLAAAAAAATVFLLLVATTLILEVDDDEGVWIDALAPVGILLFVLMPVSIAIALLRFRLYEIDRVVSRTVTYGLLAGVLALVYAVAVFLLRSLSPFGGPLPVAGSTLVVAALFNPLRKRVQEWVNRRFNRSRFVAEQVMDQLAGDLRDEIDSSEIVEGWVGAVVETMQPTAIGVWVR